MVAESRFFCDSLGLLCFDSDLTHAPKRAEAELCECTAYLYTYL